MRVEDWDFADIARGNRERAERLRAAGSSAELLRTLEVSLRSALRTKQVRFGADDYHCDPRVIIQFPVAVRIYDWFFNARSGYRAQFWLGVTEGQNYNERVVTLLTAVLSEAITDCAITLRKIKTRIRVKK